MRAFIRRDFVWLNSGVIIKNNFGYFVKQPWDSIVFLLIHTFLSVIIKYRIGIGIFVYQIINIRCTGMRGRNAAMEKKYAFDEIRRIVSPILQNYGVSRAYLFGSYARGEATEHRGNY